MRIREVTNTTKPLTPDKARVQALQRGVDAAKQALKRERAMQQLRKAQRAYSETT